MKRSPSHDGAAAETRLQRKPGVRSAVVAQRQNEKFERHGSIALGRAAKAGDGRLRAIEHAGEHGSHIGVVGVVPEIRENLPLEVTTEECVEPRPADPDREATGLAIDFQHERVGEHPTHAGRVEVVPVGCAAPLAL